MIKLLIGGSPCTKWSIAQKKDREVTASGEGWELFLNYKIAKDKFKPDFFLYENNKSAAQAIKDQISIELGVPLMHINSALVSAQNRQRFYAFNWTVPQPEDRGIFLKDILESGCVDKDKSYCLKHQAGNARDYFKKHHTQVAFEPVGVRYRNRRNEDGHLSRRFKTDGDAKANALTMVVTDSMVAEPIRVGGLPRPNGEISTSQAMRIYSDEGKSTTLSANGGGMGGKTGLYAIPVNETKDGKAQYIRVTCYEVKDGLIEIKGAKYKIKLPDGFYIIRKLSVTECCRLQTLPDDYCRAVSASRAYTGLGGGLDSRGHHPYPAGRTQGCAEGRGNRCPLHV